jgi:hypothetical protein
MKVLLIVDGIERQFKGDYYLLHNLDWNEVVRESLDGANK